MRTLVAKLKESARHWHWGQLLVFQVVAALPTAALAVGCALIASDFHRTARQNERMGHFIVTRGYELAVEPSGWERSERRRKASLFPEECERGDDICRLQRVTSFPRELVSRHYERIRIMSLRSDFNAYEFLKSDSVLRRTDSALADAEIAAWDREMQDELARRKADAAFVEELAQRQRLIGTGLYALVAALGASSLFLSLYSLWHWSAARGAK